MRVVGKITGAVLVVVTCTLQFVGPISFSEAIVIDVIPSEGGSKVIEPVSVMELLIAPVVVVYAIFCNRESVSVQLTSTVCPFDTEPAERFILHTGVRRIFGLLFQNSRVVRCAGIESGQLVFTFILSTYAAQGAPGGQD